MSERRILLDIEGMTCASCVGKVERALLKVDRVDEAVVDLMSRTVSVTTELDDAEPLVRAVAHVGYGARPHREEPEMGLEASRWLWRLLVATLLTLPVLVLTFVVPHEWWSQRLAWALSTPVVFVAGWPFFRSAGRAARYGTTTMDTLIALGASAAYAYSVWADLVGRHDHYFDTAAVIVTLVLLGRFLEARARAGATDAARSLLERGAKEAVILEDGHERRIAVSDLRPGMRAVVRPGEKIPADGVVKEGSSWADLSLLTGESVPVDVGPGDEVVGASINGHAPLVVFISRVGEHTRLAEIARLLRSAQGSKAPVQRLADRVSSVFVPIVRLGGPRRALRPQPPSPPRGPRARRAGHRGGRRRCGPRVLGLVGLSDRIRPEAREAITRLRDMGLEVALMSGDRRAVASAIGAAVGIDRVLAEVFPEDKVAEVERLRSQGHRVVFVGDGLNDAPALAAADVGIAIGSGTDVALAAADVNLLGASLGSVGDALHLARRTYRVIGQNLAWAFAYNVIMIPLAMAGVLTPAWAAAAMAGSSVSVVANALRLRHAVRPTASPGVVMSGAVSDTRLMARSSSGNERTGGS